MADGLVTTGEPYVERGRKRRDYTLTRRGALRRRRRHRLLRRRRRPLRFACVLVLRGWARERGAHHSCCLVGILRARYVALAAMR